MGKHGPPLDTVRDLVHLANEPLRLFIHMLYQVGETGDEVATIADALQQVASYRTDAAFQAVEEQVGSLRVRGIPKAFGEMQSTPEVTVTLIKPQKSE